MENPLSNHGEEAIGGFAPRRSGRARSSTNKGVQNPPMESISIEDVMKIQASTQDLQTASMKRPVSILQELLSRRGITPSYELVQIEGAIHEPTFRYRVSFNDKEVPFTALGAGRSKKEAKHTAAKALIDKLLGASGVLDMSTMSQPNITNGDSVTTTPIKNDLQENFEDKNLGNPIGWLQELCMARRWPPPTYETEMEVGLPHERQFTIACTILKYREIGKGKSKKVAKRLAAHKMWAKLQETTNDPNQVSFIEDDGNDENRPILNRYVDLKDAHIPTLTNQYSKRVAEFHKTLKGSSGDKLTQLQLTCLNEPELDFIHFLRDIAIEQNFEVTYVDIEEKSYSGRCQCLVQLSTLPVAVCHGSGQTPDEAQRSAAQIALEYLKIMTKK